MNKNLLKAIISPCFLLVISHRQVTSWSPKWYFLILYLKVIVRYIWLDWNRIQLWEKPSRRKYYMRSLQRGKFAQRRYSIVKCLYLWNYYICSAGVKYSRIRMGNAFKMWFGNCYSKFERYSNVCRKFDEIAQRCFQCCHL